MLENMICVILESVIWNPLRWQTDIESISKPLMRRQFQKYTRQHPRARNLLDDWSMAAQIYQVFPNEYKNRLEGENEMWREWLIRQKEKTQCKFLLTPVRFLLWGKVRMGFDQPNPLPGKESLE